MRSVVRWVVAVVVVLHGLIHFLGAAKGFAWADVSQLRDPIGPGLGVVWLAAGALTVSAGVLLAGKSRWFWVPGAVAVVASQAVIFTSWNDAKVGSVANAVLLVAVILGYAAQGPTSFRAEYRRRAKTALRAPQRDGVVTEGDLAMLPLPVAAYIRRSGALGQPRVANFRARIHGRIRASAQAPWMTFTGEQVSTYGPKPSRLFIMDATLFGVPVDVLHSYIGPAATMRVKALSLVPIVDAGGPEMDRAETVTLLNDLCLLAPAALIEAPIRWQPVDADHVRAIFTNAGHTVTAELVFNQEGDLVDFVSDDRLRSSRDGKTFTRQRWSTPVRDYRTFGSRRVCTNGEGRWHAPAPEGDFAYLDFNLDGITYNASNARTRVSVPATASPQIRDQRPSPAHSGAR